MRVLAVTLLVFQVCSANLLPSYTKNKDMNEEIYKGTTAVRGQIPYMVRCEQTNKVGTTTLCGGSLISRRWVISAAHCAVNMVSIKVYLGMTDSQNTSGVLTYIVNKPDIKVHPNYTAEANGDDVSLYKLPSDVPLENYPYISTIALPKRSQAPPSTFDNFMVISSGWGITKDRSQIPQYLQYVNQTILGHTECNNLYSKLVRGSNPVKDDMICGDRSKGGTCQGDSGGPAAATGTDGKPLLVGINSWGVGRCNSGYPDIFVNVAYHLQWISSTTGLTFN